VCHESLSAIRPRYGVPNIDTLPTPPECRFHVLPPMTTNLLGDLVTEAPGRGNGGGTTQRRTTRFIDSTECPARIADGCNADVVKTQFQTMFTACGNERTVFQYPAGPTAPIPRVSYILHSSLLLLFLSSRNFIAEIYRGQAAWIPSEQTSVHRTAVLSTMTGEVESKFCALAESPPT